MSRSSTRGPEDHDRERRDRLELLQVELREVREAMHRVETDAQREHAELEKTLAAEEARAAAANDRLFSLRAAQKACEARRAGLEEQIRKARLERDGPVEQVGRFDEPPGEQDWRVLGARRIDEAIPRWVPVGLGVLGALLWLLWTVATGG